MGAHRDRPANETVTELDAAGVTRRERDVLTLLARRRSNAEIAEELFVSLRTAESHVSSLLTKLSCVNRRQLADRATTLSGLAELPGTVLASNLPAALTSFVGREHEMTSIEHAQARSRLVTIVGPGGCGKTRLAVEVARRSARAYRNGVAFVDLSAIGDPALVDHTVSDALGVRTARNQRLVDALADFVAPRHFLLVIDNCEHLIDPCARLVETLLVRGPDLRVLATSRESFSLAGETVWRVPPLTLPRLLVAPEDQSGPPSDEATAGIERQALEADAVVLFLQRAKDHRPDIATELGSRAITAIAEICRRLDGMPLAIELVAARLGALSADDLVTRLAGSFLLESSSRTATARHRTLRATLDWSHDLLLPEERQALHRLAVFPGSFSLDAAAAIVEALGDAPIEVLLASLVTKSLLATVPSRGGLRYRMLEVTRQYADEQLAASDAGSTRRRHCDWFVALAERAAAESCGVDQETWLARLDVERDNVRAALTWSLDCGENQLGLRLAAATVWYWHLRGSYSEGLGWFERLLTATGHNADAEALRAAGRLAYDIGDYDRALGWFTQCRRHCESTGDLAGARKALNNIANIDWARGEFTRAAATWRRCLDTAYTLGDREGATIVLGNLGLVARVQGDDDEAMSLFEECRRVHAELGDAEGVASALDGLGQLLAERGDFDDAGRRYAEALELRRRIGHRYGIGSVLAHQAALDISRARFESAERRLDESLAIASATSDRHLIANTQRGRADLAAALDDHELAGTLYQETLEHFQELGEPLGVAHALLGAGSNALASGEPGAARSNFAHCSTLYSRMGHKRGTAAVLAGQAALARSEANAPAAETADRQALAIYADVRTPRMAAACLEGLAESAAMDGRMERSVVLIAAAAAMRERAGTPAFAAHRKRLDQIYAAARRQLGAGAMAIANVAGDALSDERALAFAIGDANPNP